MREWHLHSGSPLSLTLVCDARLGPTDYIDDQIWELKLGSGDPPALSLHTTYGLRAKAMRIFPRFTEGETTKTDPTEFTREVELHQIFPNYIEMTFAPFPDIDVQAEVWVPHSHAVTGRLSITNNSPIARKLRFEMVGQLAANEGQRMAPFEMSAATLLAGYSGGLSPVLFMTGGAKAGPGPHPSLSLTIQLEPGDQRQVTWVQAALSERESSFTMARDLAAQNWEATTARIEMLNSSQVEIYTGESGWDAAFMLSQKQAASLLVGPTPHLPHISFVLTRQPDQGYSLRGDGSDYNHLWNGQPALETYYLSGILLPIAPEIVKGLLRNFLAAQVEDGYVDWKPGLGGQRSRLMATPLLAGLAWRIYEHTQDEDYLKEVYPGLLKFFHSWFTSGHDRDSDGIPEWDHPLQAGWDYHPVFSHWQTASVGVEISTAESPALGSFLYRECQALLQISRQIGQEAEIPALTQKGEHLKAKVEATWEEQEVRYIHVDRDTHQSTNGALLLEGKGSGSYIIQRTFEQPVRLLIQVRTDETIRRHPLLFVHGKGASGNHRVERIKDDQFRWMPGFGLLTGKYVYSLLERLEVRGLEAEDQISIHSVDYRFLDLATLGPLWGGIPETERAQALVDEILTNPSLFWREYGLPTCPRPPDHSDQENCWSVSLPWNQLVAEGLLEYGFFEPAVELLTRQMRALIEGLTEEHAFRRAYHADSGQGMGEIHALAGIAPVGLFLELLGVRLISSRRVGLSGTNPFPWPVTVKYRGLTVMRQKEKTVVIFPDNQTITVTDPAPRMISLAPQE